MHACNEAWSYRPINSCASQAPFLQSSRSEDIPQSEGADSQPLIINLPGHTTWRLYSQCLHPLRQRCRSRGRSVLLCESKHDHVKPPRSTCLFRIVALPIGGRPLPSRSGRSVANRPHAMREEHPLRRNHRQQELYFACSEAAFETFSAPFAAKD